jgi:hypothetical protein
MTYTQPICFDCKHYDQETGHCAAFPKKEIPDEIYIGTNKHTEPLPKQGNEIVFEPKKKP